MMTSTLGSVVNRSTAWRVRIAAVVVFLTSAAFAFSNNKVSKSEVAETKNEFGSGKVPELIFSPKTFPSHPDVRGLIRTIRVALPPDRDSFEISTADGTSLVRTINLPTLLVFLSL